MFIHPNHLKKYGKRHAYWGLVESYRTERGPRQRVVSSLGLMPEGQRLGVAQRGYSRDQRPGCKQVCIALVVSRCGMPIGYEVFAGNKADVTTVEEIVTTMESRHGEAKCVWVMDRGMTSQKNIEFLRKGGRRYIVGTPKAMLKKYEKELAQGDWNLVHEGLEVKKLVAPAGTEEVFILCRSADRSRKEKAMHEKFVTTVREGLEKLSAACMKKKLPMTVVGTRLGRLLEKNWPAARAF